MCSCSLLSDCDAMLYSCFKFLPPWPSSRDWSPLNCEPEQALSHWNCFCQSIFSWQQEKELRHWGWVKPHTRVQVLNSWEADNEEFWNIMDKWKAAEALEVLPGGKSCLTCLWMGQRGHSVEATRYSKLSTVEGNSPSLPGKTQHRWLKSYGRYEDLVSDRRHPSLGFFNCSQNAHSGGLKCLVFTIHYYEALWFPGVGICALLLTT